MEVTPQQQELQHFASQVNLDTLKNTPKRFDEEEQQSFQNNGNVTLNEDNDPSQSFSLLKAKFKGGDEQKKKAVKKSKQKPTHDSTPARVAKIDLEIFDAEVPLVSSRSNNRSEGPRTPALTLKKQNPGLRVHKLQ